MAQATMTGAGSAQKSGRGWHGNPEGHAQAGRKGGAKVGQDRDHMRQMARTAHQIIVRFWVASLVFALFALTTLKLR